MRRILAALWEHQRITFIVYILQMKRVIVPIWRIICYPIIFVVVNLCISVIWYFVAFFTYLLDVVSTGREIILEESVYALSASLNWSLISLVSGTITFLIICLMQRKEWKEASFWRVSNIPASGIVMCAFIGVALNFFVGGIINLAGLNELFPDHADLMESIFSGHIIIQILSTAIMAPVLEEVTYRGIILKRLANTSMKFHLANIIQAFLFGVFHFNIMQSSYAFLIGIIFGLVYAKFKTIWAPIVMHITFNLLSVIMSYLLSDYYVEVSYTSIAIMVVVISVVIGLFIYRIKKVDNIV